MFSQKCSIYAHGKDSIGKFVEEYVDEQTGEVYEVPVKEVTINDFFLTDRWRVPVQKLRDMIASNGPKVKASPEYENIKRSLPCATISGRFAYRNRKHFLDHTGWLVLDMDFSDNSHIEGFLDSERMYRVFRNIPSVALVMRSCSGMGYLALVRLAPPTEMEMEYLKTINDGFPILVKFHKMRTWAFYNQYQHLGIVFDKKCDDVTRLRFASWDDKPYRRIRPIIPYGGFLNEKPKIEPRRDTPSHEYTQRNREQSSIDILNRIERLVTICVAQNVDVTQGYDDWCRTGWALKEFGERGLDLFHKLSSVNPRYKYAETERKWKDLGEPDTISYLWLLRRFKDLNIR